MSTIATELDVKLRRWEPKISRRVSRLVAEIIALVDRESIAPTAAAKRKQGSRRDPFFSDTKVYRGPTPKDLAANHGAYLYDAGR
jgi:hypothetical protein